MGGVKGLTKGGVKGVQNPFVQKRLWQQQAMMTAMARWAKGGGKGTVGKNGKVPDGKGPVGKGMMTGKGGKDFKGKGKGKRPRGPNLPRTRVSEEPVIGTVLEWKGKYGWLKPHDRIDHPSAANRENKVWISQNDLIGLTELVAGTKCQFIVYSDASGLGAEECLAF